VNVRKKLAVEIAAIMCGLGGVLAGAYVLLERGCDLGAGICGNEVVGESFSPNHRMKVTVFERDCGATTGFSTQASLLPADQKLAVGAGNIFIADDRRGAAPSGPGGGPRVTVRWISDAQVFLGHHPSVQIFKAETRHEGINVGYEIGP
jgi:hypothetical protein